VPSHYRDPLPSRKQDLAPPIHLLDMLVMLLGLVMPRYRKCA
jgi:hypothetical protein